MRKLLWFAFQLAIIGFFVFGGFAEDFAASENRAVTARDVGMVLFLGICIAWLATALIIKLADLSGWLAARLRRQKSSSNDGGSVIAPRSELLNPPDTSGTGKHQIRQISRL